MADSTITARQKIRAARAKANAERAARERRVDTWAEEYLKQTERVARAGEKYEQAVRKATDTRDATVAAATRKQDQAIAEMMSEGESAEDVAKLLEMSKADVAAGRRRHDDLRAAAQTETGSTNTEDTDGSTDAGSSASVRGSAA